MVLNRIGLYRWRVAVALIVLLSVVFSVAVSPDVAGALRLGDGVLTDLYQSTPPQPHLYEDIRVRFTYEPGAQDPILGAGNQHSLLVKLMVDEPEGADKLIAQETVTLIVALGSKVTYDGIPSAFSRLRLSDWAGGVGGGAIKVFLRVELQGTSVAAQTLPTDAYVTPAKPILASPADGSQFPSGAPLLAWQPARAAASYTIQVTDDRGSWEIPHLKIDAQVFPATDSGQASYQVPTTRALPPGAYYWNVRSSNHAGDSDPSDTWGFVVSACYQLSTSASPGDSGSIKINTPQNCTGGFLKGTVVSITAMPIPRYRFVGWAGDASGSSITTSITINSNQTVVAYFEDIMAPAATATLAPTATITAIPSATPGPGAAPTATATATLPPLPALSTPTPTPGPSGGRQVSYHSGWNLVAGPRGATFPQANALLYTSQGGAYTTLPNNQGVTEGWGYWAYFATDTTVALSGAGSSFYATSLGPGQTKLVGNPSGTKSAVVKADKVYTYDPVGGYTISFGSAILGVGQGAWVYSASGGAVTVTAQ